MESRSRMIITDFATQAMLCHMDNRSQLVEVSCNINVQIATDRFASIE
jgi:hypothetical protein